MISPNGTDSRDTDLRWSLEALSRLALGEGQVGLEDLLRHVAEFAVRAIPGADGAGLTLLETDHLPTIVASTQFVAEVDAIQYGLGEGPCIMAAAERRTVRSGALDTDPNWPRFGPRAAKLGVQSALSLPLLVGKKTLGAMNVYAHAVDAFDDRAILLGEMYAVPAAISVQNAQALSQAQRLALQLQSALSTRAVIDQALGIVMSRSGCTSPEAFDKLRSISQVENRKLAMVAQQVVDEAIRRARARNTRAGD
jgi:GAF domain-containing protein